MSSYKRRWTAVVFLASELGNILPSYIWRSMFVPSCTTSGRGALSRYLKSTEYATDSYLGGIHWTVCNMARLSCEDLPGQDHLRRPLITEAEKNTDNRKKRQA
ncbi:hypothetical protein WA026_003967 [Henosepilachna vigintioctopunctata]|uniref:Secreted protein n=1 Tax=Henosepilachna vigintioctopunctata TaxID=420089 RepID=A0AAW1U883_9CUCU